MPWSSYCPQRMPSLVSDDPLTHRLTPSPIWGMGGLLTNERAIWGHTQAVDCCQCRNAWTEQASAMPVSLAKTWAGEALEALGDHGVWCLRSDHDDHRESVGIKPRKRLVRQVPEPLAVPSTVNQVWSMDFMHDPLADGCRGTTGKTWITCSVSRPTGCGPTITTARTWPWADLRQNSGWPWPLSFYF